VQRHALAAVSLNHRYHRGLRLRDAHGQWLSQGMQLLPPAAAPAARCELAVWGGAQERRMRPAPAACCHRLMHALAEGGGHCFACFTQNTDEREQNREVHNDDPCRNGRVC